MTQPLLSVKRLTIALDEQSRFLVDDISLTVQPGQILGVVGESGCGKSLTALSILRLIPANMNIQGEILLNGENILQMSAKRLRQIRGGEIAMIFQEPMNSLNPVFTVGDQICEAISTHLRLGHSASRRLALELLAKVGVPSPEQRINDYPHQLSGGMRQRIMIAMALACRPKLLIADEPTTALDVTIQAQILELLRGLSAEFGMAVIIITHDLGVVADLADQVVVMYAGEIVERAPAAELFKQPRHPYTEGLLKSSPPVDVDVDRLHTILGSVPDSSQKILGCQFASRCAYAEPACLLARPPLLEIRAGHEVACIRDLDART